MRRHALPRADAGDARLGQQGAPAGLRSPDGRAAVLKPLRGAGGDGIFLLREDDLNLNAIIGP